MWLSVFHLNWGLPNGNASWAADAPGPLTILNVCWRSLREFNSGWFWFKYPFGYPLLLGIAYAPYLAWVWLTGGLHGFSTSYPYGFENPDHVLYVLTMIGRCVNVALITATVAISYGIGRRLLDRRAGLLAAWFAATAYPLVYYAHTTNQDAAYLCWLMLALWAALVAAQDGARWAHLLLGVAAAMAMATKEQGFSWLLVLPFLLVAGAYRREPGWHGPWRRVRDSAFNANTLAGAAASVVTFAVASGALVNPLGVWNRLQDLRGYPVPGVSARLTPIEFSFFKGFGKELGYIRSLADVLESSLGPALFVVAVIGVVFLAARRRRAAAWLLIPAAAYYVLSLRTHDVLVLRYALPLIPPLALMAAAVCSAVWDVRPRLGAILASGLCLVALGRAVELDALLLRDPRYAAEQWMKDNAAAGSSVEVYQKLVYLPRLNGYRLRQVPMAERSIAELLERQPEYLVISSAGRKQVTQSWNKDWKEAGSLLGEDPEAARFLAALEGGELPYRLAAHVAAAPPVLLRLRITSVSPQIWIYRHQPS
jgi:hypothetical protein